MLTDGRVLDAWAVDHLFAWLKIRPEEPMITCRGPGAGMTVGGGGGGGGNGSADVVVLAVGATQRPPEL